MICYKDRTFCPFYKDCAKQNECGIALTPKVLEAANKWWGKPDAPIAMFASKPDCWEDDK